MPEVVYGKRCKNRKLFENQNIVCKCPSCHGTRARLAVKNLRTPPPGPANPNWKGGPAKCLDCDKVLSDRVHKRCNACDGKAKRQEPHRCQDCGAVVKRNTTKRCKQCFVQWRRGENHHLWKGGESSPAKQLRNTHQKRVWARAVLERDGFTCRLCSARGGKLDAHHILRWADHPELRFDLDNGVALCRDCHLNVVHEGSWSNVPLNFWS